MRLQKPGSSKFIIIVLVAIVLIALGGGYYYFIFRRTPIYTFTQIAKAYETHNVNLFEEYVDIDTFSEQLVDDCMTWINQTNFGNDSDVWSELGNIVAKGMINGMVNTTKPQLVSAIKKSIIDSVKNNSIDNSNDNNLIPLKEVTNIRTSIMRKNFSVGKSDGDTIVKVQDPDVGEWDLLLKESNGRLQVVKVINLTDILTKAYVESVIENSKKAIDKGDFDAAISELKAIQQTDEVKSLIDSAYYGLAEKDFKSGDYDKVITDISNIKFDKNIIQKSQSLLSKAQKCKQLLASAKDFMSKAEYSQAKKVLLTLKQLNGTKEVEELLNELNSPWLLDSNSIKEAVAYGIKNKNNNFMSMVSPWTFGNIHSYKTSIIIVTPYLFLASAAQDNAKKYIQTTLSKSVQILKDEGNIMPIYAVVYGDEIDFAEDIDAVIKVNGKIIHPIKSTKEDFAETTNQWPYSPAYFATNAYYFDLKEIPRDAKIEVIIIHPNKEDKFYVDLSKLK